MGRFSSTNAISIFPNTGEPFYVTLLRWRCHEKCIHLFAVRNIENWTFHPFPTLGFSEAFRTDFFYQQSDRCVPLGNNLGPISSKSESKESKQLFYQPSSLYLEMTITNSTKQTKFPHCRFLGMFRRVPSIILRVYCKLKRMTGQLLEIHDRRHGE